MKDESEMPKDTSLPSEQAASPMPAKKGSRKGIPHPVVIPEEHIDYALEAYERGQTIEQTAKKLGYSRMTLYRRVMNDAERWKAAQEAHAMDKYQRARQMHEAVCNEIVALEQGIKDKGGDAWEDSHKRDWYLAHARIKERAVLSMLNSAEWELERVLARLYGKQADQLGGPSIIVEVNL
jgi:Helix-turn-helix domain of resolvase